MKKLLIRINTSLVGTICPMKERLKSLAKESNIESILEGAYFIAFIMCIAFSFLNTTTLEIEWPSLFFENIRTFMIALILVRVGYSKRYSRSESILVLTLCILFCFAAKRNGYEELVNYLILILGAKGISFKRIIKVYFVTVTVLFAYTIVSALLGWTENLIYNREGRRQSIAFGIVYPTDFSAHVFYWMLTYFYLRSEKLRYIELGLAAMLGFAVYWFCDARMNMFCIFGAAAVFAVHKTVKGRKEKSGKTYEMNELFSSLLVLSATISAIIMISLTLFYNSGNKTLVFLDNLLSNRLRLGHKGISVYNFTLWGRYIPMKGLGGLTESAKYYFFLDSSYLYIALQYGLIILGTILLISMLIGIKAKNKRDWTLLLIMGMVAVQCMVEHHFLEPAYNPFFWALFAELTLPKKRRIPLLFRKTLMKSEVM